jgi:PAS domain S-box-containing protein
MLTGEIREASLTLALFGGQDGAIDTLAFLEKRLEIGLWAWDIDPTLGDWSRGLYGRKMRWSSGFYRLLGLEPGNAEPSFHLLQEMTHPDDRYHPSEIEAILHATIPYEREFRVVQPHGIMRWMQCRGEMLQNDLGVAVRAVGVMRDITARHEAEHALDEQARQFRSLIGLVDHPVWIMRNDGSMVDIFGWQKLTGQDIAQSLGMGWTEALHPEDRRQTFEAWRAAVEHSGPFEIEHRVLTLWGGYRWFRSRAAAASRATNPSLARVGVSVDIHDAKISLQADNSALTGAQIRAARGILNWSVRNLAEATDLSPAMIRRLEETNGVAPIPGSSALKIKQSLHRAGVEFLFPAGGKPGVSPS